MKLCWDWNLFWPLSHIIPKISSSFPALFPSTKTKFPWAREGMQHKPQRRRRLLTAPKNWRHLVWFPSLNFSATTWFLLLNHHKSFKGDTCFSEICPSFQATNASNETLWGVCSRYAMSTNSPTILWSRVVSSLIYDISHIFMFVDDTIVVVLVLPSDEIDPE